MEYLAVFLVGYVVGWWWRGIMVLYKLSRDPQHTIKMLEELKEIHEHEANGTPIEETKFGKGTELFIERVNDQLYAYIKDTNEFVAQGPNLETLLEDAHKRYPNKTFFGDIPADSPAKELA